MASIVQAPAALSLQGVQGNPFSLTLDVTLADGSGDPINWDTITDITGIVTGITPYYTSVIPIDSAAPDVNNNGGGDGSGSISVLWTADQTEAFAAYTSASWSLSITFGDDGKFAVLAGPISMNPSTQPGNASSSTTADLAVSVDGATVTLAVTLSGGGSGGGGTPTAATTVAQYALGLPFAVVEGVNDTFEFQNSATAFTLEAFTIAPGTITTADEAVAAFGNAVGESSELFSTIATPSLITQQPQLPYCYAASAPSFPVTITEGVNDTFVYTPIGGDPVTFTVAPNTYTNTSDLGAAFFDATDSDSVQFDSLLGDADTGADTPLWLLLIGQSVDNEGDILTAGPTDALASYGFTSPTTFLGGTGTQAIYLTMVTAGSSYNGSAIRGNDDGQDIARGFGFNDESQFVNGSEGTVGVPTWHMVEFPELPYNASPNDFVNTAGGEGQIVNLPAGAAAGSQIFIYNQAESFDPVAVVDTTENTTWNVPGFLNGVLFVWSQEEGFWEPVTPALVGDVVTFPPFIEEVGSTIVQGIQGFTVAQTAPTDGQALVYSEESGEYIPTAVGGGGSTTLSLSFGAQGPFDVPVFGLPAGWHESGTASMGAQLTVGTNIGSGILLDTLGNPVPDGFTFSAFIFVEDTTIFDIIAMNTFSIGNAAGMLSWISGGDSPVSPTQIQTLGGIGLKTVGSDSINIEAADGGININTTGSTELIINAAGTGSVLIETSGGENSTGIDITTQATDGNGISLTDAGTGGISLLTIGGSGIAINDESGGGVSVSSSGTVEVGAAHITIGVSGVASGNDSVAIGDSGIAYSSDQTVVAATNAQSLGLGASQHSVVVAQVQTTAGDSLFFNTCFGETILLLVDVEGTPVFSRTIHVHAVVVARRTDTPGTDSAWQCDAVLRGNGTDNYSWVGGDPVFTVIAQDADAASWVPTMGVSEWQVIAEATGADGATINWEMTLNLDEVAG